MGLFSGKPDNKVGPVLESTPRAQPRAARPPSTPDVPTIIGRDAVIKGEIVSDHDMLIEGRVEGKIRGQRSVVIGESGNVQAEVHASVVSIKGEVHGDCEASKKVEITSTGKVFGNISAEAIVVAEGATFRGASRMMKHAKPKAVEAASKTPAAGHGVAPTTPPPPSVR